MSHNGPTGPLGNSVSFYDAFTAKHVVDFFNMNPENKVEYVVIDYGQPGDKIAYADLCRAAKVVPQMAVSRILPKDITPQMMFDLAADRKITVSGADYCRLPSLGESYDCAGQFKGFKGIPGDIGWAPFSLQRPPIMYQHWLTDLILYPQEGSPTSSMSGIISKGGFYDAPIHVFIVSEDPGADMVFHYESLLNDLKPMRPNLTMKVVSYAQAILAERLPGVVFISEHSNRRTHEALWEKCKGLTRMQLQAYVHGKSDLSFERFIELILDRKLTDGERALTLMCDNGISGGFRRGTLQITGRSTFAQGPRIIGVMDEPAHIGGVRTMTLPNTGDWSVLTVPQKKRPKGPITMPGIGERKKKGKHKTKW